IQGDKPDEDRASAWLGMIVHGLLSWKARIGRMMRGEAHARVPMPAANGLRPEPHFDGRGYSKHENEIEDDDEAPVPRKRAAARAPARRSGSGYVLPSLNLLAAPRASERTTLSRDIIEPNPTPLQSPSHHFRVPDHIINSPPC